MISLSGDWTYNNGLVSNGTVSFSVGPAVVVRVEQAGGNLTVYGGSGDDTILGGTGDDTIYGGAGNDTLHGGSGANSLYGEGGDDTLYLESATDSLYGGDGDDLFILGADNSSHQTFTAASFARIEGGDGLDALMLNGSDNTLDLRNLAPGQLKEIEIIDLSGNGNGGNTLRLDGASLGNMGASSLTVGGDAGGRLELEGDWAFNGTDGFTLNGNTVYVQDGLQISIQAGGGRISLPGEWSYDEVNDLYILNSGSFSSSVSLSGASGVVITAPDIPGAVLSSGAGDDLFILTDTDGDNVVSGSDFASIDGGGGSNTLSIGGLNLTPGLGLDLTDLAAGQIRNIGGLDLSGSGDNTVLINASTFTGLGATSLAVSGDAGDTLSLQGNWTFEAGLYKLGANSLSAGSLQISVSMDGAGTVSLGDGGGTVVGSAGADLISGGAGADILRGGLGSDTLSGGGGSDLFVWKSGDYEADTDWITDFTLDSDAIFLDGLFSGLGKQADIQEALAAGDLNISGSGNQAVLTYLEQTIDISFTGGFAEDLTSTAGQTELLVRILSETGL